jgi:hypothetical protein
MPDTQTAKKDLAKAPTILAYSVFSLISMLYSDKMQVNRNKRSMGLSFQHPAGVDILHRLVKECDVLVENYLPGSLAKYAMDYDTVSKINPKIVYASITGYGQTGPYRNRAGYDVMVEAYVFQSCSETNADSQQRVRLDAYHRHKRWTTSKGRSRSHGPHNWTLYF